MLSIFIDVKKFVDIEYFAREVKSYSNFVRSSPPAEGVDKVMIPGDNELKTYNDRIKNGIPISEEAWELITLRGRMLGLEGLDRFKLAIIWIKTQDLIKKKI